MESNKIPWLSPVISEPPSRRDWWNRRGVDHGVAQGGDRGWDGWQGRPRPRWWRRDSSRLGCTSWTRGEPPWGWLFAVESYGGQTGMQEICCRYQVKKFSRNFPKYFWISAVSKGVRQIGMLMCGPATGWIIDCTSFVIGSWSKPSKLPLNSFKFTGVAKLIDSLARRWKEKGSSQKRRTPEHLLNIILQKNSSFYSCKLMLHIHFKGVL